MTSSPETPPASSSNAGKTDLPPIAEAIENPQAFPVSTIDGFTLHGMTLRDWFAGQCLVSSPLSSFGDRDYLPRAWRCYEMADAMLEARAVQS